VPVFLGNFEEVEEAHCAVLGGFGRLVEQSLRMALHILTRDLANATKVSPFLFSQSIPPTPEFSREALRLALLISGAQGEVSS
jgi:hypothetical protein